VGILGVDRFALGKTDRQPRGRDVHDLVAGAQQVHLDAAAVRVIDRPVLEALDREIGPQLPVDPPQQVEIEGSGHSAGIVVGGFQETLGATHLSKHKSPSWADDGLASLVEILRPG